MLDKLDGNKTYITGLAMLIVAVLLWQGVISMTSKELLMWLSGLLGVGIMALRHAIEKGA